MNALKYKAIILDEVHERSVESDLVLVCIKHFLLKYNDIRFSYLSLLMVMSNPHLCSCTVCDSDTD